MKGARNARRRLKLEFLEPRVLLAVDGFAPIDGVGNNLDNPEWGATFQQFTRLAPAAYEDGIGDPARSDQMNAREISNLLSDQTESIPNDRFITAMWFQWGQFLDHDINRVFDVAPFEQLTPHESLDISPEFPFNRSPYDPATGTTTPREHVNHITAFIDGSVVYGSDEAHALALRTMVGGKLKSQDSAVGELLPFNTDALINAPTPFAPNFFVAGDVRANENVGLTSMQTLWVREHNRIADELAATEFAGQDLTDAEVDEHIYQLARQRVMGLIQHITYNEFLPSTLGFNALGTYQGYDPTLDPQITNEFTTAAYRIGHTTLTNELPLPDGESIPLAEAFFRPDVVLDIGIDGLLQGLATEKMEEVDSKIVDAVRNFLDDGPGFDLAAINIQRGRDHGLPDYNTIRAAVGLEPLDSFHEMTSDSVLADLFTEIYGSPDDADPWIAMISEDHVPGTMAGETINAILIDQFHRLRAGDRFYFENALSQDLIDQIKATRLSDVIRRNTDAVVQDEVFWTPDTLVFRNGLDNEWLIRDFGDNGGAEVVFFGVPGERDPSDRTETIPVRRDEPINALIVAGTNELGDGFFIPNALVSSPLADQGIDEFVITATVDFFEGYGLGGNDEWIFESDIASIFASGDAGRDIMKAKTNAQGAEVAFTGGTGRDDIRIHARQAAFAFADGGAGRDDIHIRARNAFRVHAFGDNGRDDIAVWAAGAELVEVSGGRGRDDLFVWAPRAGAVSVTGDGGHDDMLVKARRAESVFVSGDNGNDTILVDARRAESVEVLGGRGWDVLIVWVGWRTDADVDGGPGWDWVLVF